jgi:MFS family permease
MAANAILGIWVTSQITFVLAGHLHVPAQHFVGSLYQQEPLLSAYLGGYVLLFSGAVVAWAFVLGHLPKLPVLLLTLFGSVLACLGLVGLNHGGAPLLWVPLVIIGVFLEAGFTPPALAYLADQSQALAQDRGLVMGLYSVILGVGSLLGNVLGGLFAQWWYFDGLALLTVIFAVLGMLSIASLKLAPRNQRT